ncbi:hypothetical protein GCM10018987_58460 [Streptomyces cremeus]
MYVPGGGGTGSSCGGGMRPPHGEADDEADTRGPGRHQRGAAPLDRMHPNSVSQARTVLRRALAQLGCDGEVISDAVLAASELVANATEHAGGRTS